MILTPNLTILGDLIVHSHLWDTVQPTDIGDAKISFQDIDPLILSDGSTT